tara:strand:- start:9452 stop:11704 length:2253 start_codon:yes stop_codon:yes gene_type:complete
MNTQRLIVERLRGIDQRYYTRPENAAIIEEMTWDTYDGWKAAGGYECITRDLYNWNYIDESLGYLSDPSGTSITSIHFYSKRSNYNEIIFEDNYGRLCVLDIGKRKAGLTREEPFRFLRDLQNVEYNGLSSGRKRYIPRNNDIGTQSCTFGGRLYLVNGVDEPIVYDGNTVDRAGFYEKPGQPKANVVVRSYHNEHISAGGADTDYFLGTRLKSWGLGSLKPKGAKSKNGSKDFIDGKLAGYQYRVTYVNSRGQESEMSEPSDMCIFECADGKKRFVQIQLPVGDDSTVARRLYRTHDQLDDFGNSIGAQVGRNFYFVREIKDNETTMFEDGLPDASLGFMVDDFEFGKYPMQAKFIASFKNCVFLTGGPDNLLRFSASGMPEVFPKRNVIDLGDSDAGKITGMYASTNSLVVFKEYGTYLVKSNPDGSFTYQTISRDIGCIAPNSIKDVPFTGLVFLSHNGIFALKGFLEDSNSPTSIIDLSTPIKETMDRVCVSSSFGSVGCLNRQDKEYWLCVPTIGEKNNLLLVWHYEVGAWSLRNNYPIGCAIETRGPSSDVIFGSSDGEVPGIFVYGHYFRHKNKEGSTAGNSDGPVDKFITRKSFLDNPVYETVPIKLNGTYGSARIAYVNLYAVAYGDIPVKLNFKINRNQELALESDKSMIQQHIDSEEKLDVYGKSSFGSDRFGYHRPIVIRFDISHINKTLVTEFAVRVTQDASEDLSRIMLVGYSVDAKLGEQRNIRALTDVLGSDRR